MDIPVKSSDANEIDREHLNKIKEIMRENFSGKGIDDEIETINIVPIEVDGPTAASSSGCMACDVGYAAANAACSLLPPFVNAACYAAASLAYGKCREINC